MYREFFSQREVSLEKSQPSKELQIIQCVLGLDKLENNKKFEHQDINRNPTTKTIGEMLEMFARVSNLQGSNINQEIENQVSLITPKHESITIRKDHKVFYITYNNVNNEKNEQSTEDSLLIPFLVSESILKIKYPKKKWGEIKELIRPIHKHFDRRTYQVDY